MELFQVTLKRGEDIQAFYDDMETPGGALHIPDRKIDVGERRPTSRTTGYMLTLEEAQEVSYDDRVEVVVPQSVLDRQQLVQQATFTGRFDKSTSPTGATFTNANGDIRVKYTNNDHHPWAILRHIETDNRSGWGANAASSSDRRVDTSVTYSASGKNVDIVIVENDTLSDHAEYSSRLVDYNWGQHYNTITGGTNYTYSHADARDNYSAEDNHPTAVAGYAAGERFGLANDANVYQLDLTYERSKSGGSSTDRSFAYIRQFHANKSINPATGRKNPTIVNVSLGTVNTYSGASVAHFQGTTLDKGDGSTFLTEAELKARGIYPTTDSGYTSNTNFSVNSPTPNSDLVDAIAEGVIVVTSGGNNNRYTDVSGGDNWDNYMVAGAAYANRNYFFNGYYPFRDYYMRGDNFSFNGAINVGALSDNTDQGKADFSNWGPGIDVYAAGERLMGAMMKDDITYGNPYYGQENNTPKWDAMGTQNGTSYAAPFIAGMLACLAEVYPHMTQAQARTYLQNNAVTGLMQDTGDTSTDWSPSEVSGSTAVWVDASDTGSYTTSGSNVTAVTDKTGTFTFGVTGTPNVSTTLDSKNVFTFSSSESIESSNEAAQTDALGNHWAIGLMQWNSRNDSQDSFWSVENNTVSASSKRDYAISAGASNFDGELDLDGLSSNRISSTIGNKEDFDSGIAQNTWVIICAIFNKTGNQIAVRVNGTNKFTPVNDYDNALNQNMDIRFFKNRANERMGGQMAEFISFAGMPGLGGTDVSEVERMEGYLAHKWAQEGSLPADHPYKSSAPATDVLNTDTDTRVTLDGSNIDRITLWKNHRQTSGNMAFNTYNKDVNTKPTTGTIYPRTRIRRRG